MEVNHWIEVIEITANCDPMPNDCGHRTKQGDNTPEVKH